MSRDNKIIQHDSEKYKRVACGRIKLVNHETPCRLCDRINWLGKMFMVKHPSVLEYHADNPTWIHDAGCEAHRAPLYLYLGGTFDSVSLYNQVHASMLRDFAEEDSDGGEMVWSQDNGPTATAGDDFVVSYSLYVDDLTDFPYYWLGLKLNIDAVKQWFKGWTIYLHVERSLIKQHDFFSLITSYAAEMHVPLKIVECTEGGHPMIERYRPMWELDSGICIVRDVDSILSLTDAKIVDCWLRDSNRDVLLYNEYLMPLGKSAGGGIGAKIDKLIPGNKIDTVVGPTRGRSQDEWRLEAWLKKVTTADRIASVQMRMTDSSVYCIDFYRDQPFVMWGNARDAKKIKVIHSWVECKEECQRVVKETSGDRYVYSHKKDNRDSMLANDKWCR